MNSPVKKFKRAVNGILLVDKPLGISSNAALQKTKHLFHAKKAGHTGSLDPLATGMLPLCFGEATKFSQYLLAADKTYEVKAQLGIRTATSDAEGEVISNKEVPQLDIAAIDKLFDQFRGSIEQIPSMYSALKHNGQPLYKLARQGITVERPSRKIQVYDLKVTDYQDGVIEFKMHCSKGTYVRTIVDDFGEKLGCGAHVIGLRRTTVGGFSTTKMHTLDELEQLYQEADPKALDHLLLPLELAVSHLPQLQLTEDMAFYFCRGQSLLVPHAPSEGNVVLHSKLGKLIGIGEVMECGKISPKRLIAQP